jgi:hypothetical protein
MLEKVLGVSAMSSWSSLIAMPSQVGVDADGTSCLLCRPTNSGCRPATHSLWFGKVLPYLVAKPFFGGVIALMGPHATTVRLGPKAIGQTLSGLITPCGGGAEFRPSLSKGV